MHAADPAVDPEQLHPVDLPRQDPLARRRQAERERGEEMRVAERRRRRKG
jgi:hypothetical protein